MRNKIPKKIIYGALASVILLSFLFLWKKPAFEFLSNVAGRLHSSFVSKFTYLGNTIESIKYIFSARTGIEVLTKRNIMLDAENQDLREENRRLRKILSMEKRGNLGSRVRCFARVIGANRDGFIYYYTIDKGKNDGIREGDGVVGEEGVLGRIVKVTPAVSGVQLITDAKSNISARDRRSRVAGILTGAGYRYCLLNYVPREKDVEIGDVIITSGMAEAFPAGIKLGEVVKVEKKPGRLSMNIKVKPFADIFSVEEVMVLKKKNTKPR